MRGIALLEVFDDAQGVQVVVEAEAMTAKTCVQRTLTGVAEGRVAYVVNQGEGLGEVFVEAESVGRGAGDLRNLHGMGEAAAEVIRSATGEDLCLTRESTEGTRLDDPLPVTLEGCAGWPKGRGMDARQQRIGRIAGDGASMQFGGHIQV
jgi:hypothetical protein